MYSLVLMAAMTASADTPAFGWRHRCSCYGSYAGACYGCAGCYGGAGCYGCWGRACYGGAACYGCNGGYGCQGCWGGAQGYGPMMPAEDGKRETAPPPKEDKSKKQGATDGQAKVIVELPADAKLYIDDHLMKTAAARRTFNTPKLEAGETYYYVVRAEIVVDGKTVVESKRLLVRAGQTVRASFNDLETAAKRIKGSESGPELDTASR